MAEHDKDLTSTVAQHYNQLKEAGLETRTQSRIFYMRNFNNWTKSILINKYLTEIKKHGHDSALSVLDLCSGKGGDLLKWKKGEIDKLVCADIAETSVEQSEVRYNENVQRNKKERFPSKMFTAEFLTADCTKLRLRDMYKDFNTLFDLTSCQFSFHYCFESLSQAQMMIRNACECLKPGGYFIGTTPNSNELVKRLRASKDMSFGNEVYRVTFLTEGKENLPLFGAKYDFHLEGVVDCPEFLVYFPAFEKLAAQYGMKLVYKKTFAEFFQQYSNESEGRSLLSKMQALESYPADESVSLVSQADNAYTAAKSRIDSLLSQQQEKRPDNNRTPKLGTLSQDEWEAASLYLVFAFQKEGVDKTKEVVEDSPRKRSHSTTEEHTDEIPPNKFVKTDTLADT